MDDRLRRYKDSSFKRSSDNSALRAFPGEDLLEGDGNGTQRLLLWGVHPVNSSMYKLRRKLFGLKIPKTDQQNTQDINTLNM